MQVHQTSQLVAAIVMDGGGLFMLFPGLYDCLKRKSLLPLTQQPLVPALCSLALGIGSLSSAFDLPHQVSHRTLIVSCLSLLVLFSGLILIDVFGSLDMQARLPARTRPCGRQRAVLSRGMPAS